MNKFGQIFEINPVNSSFKGEKMAIEIMRFQPKSENKADILFAIWTTGRRRNYTRTATKVEGKIWRFKFEGNIIDFEMI